MLFLLFLLNNQKRKNMKKITIVFLFVVLFSTFVYSGDQNNVLESSAMKIKYISLDVNIFMPINFSNYTSSDEFTYKTAIFQSLNNQEVDVSAYYYDDNGDKILGEIIDDGENKYATFKVKPITKNQYVFYISGHIVSEDKIVLDQLKPDLIPITEENKEYTKSTRYMQSDSTEIRTVANYLKKSDDLENLVYVTNWVHSYLTYDMDYVSIVNDSLSVLSDAKGVCDEFAILEAAILRAQGYPVKYVVGYANTSQEWGPHAWLEVYIPGYGWVPVDPTYNEVGSVDATHIIIEKLKDPSSKDSVISTNDVVVNFGEKKQHFTHHEVKTYEQLGLGNDLDIDVIMQKEAYQSSPHIAKLELKNKTNNHLMVLIASQLVSDVKQIYPKARKTVYYLKPLETKKFDYYFKLPDLKESYIYKFSYISQYKDKTTDLKIYHNRGNYQDLFYVYEPIIYYRNGLLVFENTVLNYTKKEKNISYAFDYNGTDYFENQKIPKYSEITYQKIFKKTEDGYLSYMLSGDYNSFKMAQILPTIETPYVFDVNIDKNTFLSEEDKNKSEIFEKIKEDSVVEKPKPDYLMIIFVCVFIVVIIGLFISKMVKKEQ
jgi:transglutaminase-like putative cysteine protease